MVQSAIPKLNESELLDVLDVLAHSLMSEVRSHFRSRAPPRARIALRHVSSPPPFASIAQARDDGSFKEGDADSLRKCVEAIRRINKFRNREGRGQANFVRSILDTYGGDDG